MQHDRVLALGFFDGIHLGHAALLNKTRERARELSLTPAAMSFDTHPDTLVFGTAVPLLNTMAERELLMRRLCGIEEVIFAHFDEAMMHMPWEVFIEDYLVRQLRPPCGLRARFPFRRPGTGESRPAARKMPRARRRLRRDPGNSAGRAVRQLNGHPRASAFRRLQNCRASARPRPACDRHRAEGRGQGSRTWLPNGESAVFPGRARPRLRRLPRGGGA